MSRINLIISDFDGTLVNTFDANYLAYKEAFDMNGLSLSRDKYKSCYGLRFDDFMNRMHVSDFKIRNTIHEIKTNIYSNFFDHIELNHSLLKFIRSFKKNGGKCALASTARKKNLFNVLLYLDIQDDFDMILSGDDVIKGKPNPEVYITIIEKMQIKSDQTLIFEDSHIGIQSAILSGANYIPIDDFKLV